MLGKITTDILESYCNCKFKSYLKLAGEKGKITEYEQLIKEARAVITYSAAVKLNIHHEENRTPIGIKLDRSVLKQGLPRFLNVLLENEELSIHFDALQRVSGTSAIGEFHYIPILFNETGSPSQKQRSLLGILGSIVGDLQGTQPVHGILIHGQAGQLRRVRMTLQNASSRQKLKELVAIRSGTTPRLSLNSHCQICEFRERCYADAKTKDDLSLLGGISEKEIAGYNKKGIFTVNQLSYNFRPRKSPKQLNKKQPTYQRALKALAVC